MVATMGTYWPKLDDKNRFVVPAAARPELAGGTYLAKGIGDKCLFLFSESQFEAHIAQMESQTPPGIRSVDLHRFFRGSVKTQQLDKQGRLPIPDELRLWARLERDLAVVALGRRFEIWDAAAYQAFDTSLDETILSLSEGVW